jgi:hypothetical protein
MGGFAFFSKTNESQDFKSFFVAVLFSLRDLGRNFSLFIRWPSSIRWRSFLPLCGCGSAAFALTRIYLALNA